MTGGRIQELSSGGGGPGHTDKKIAFFSLTILQRGPISRKTILFKVPEGGGSTLFRVEPTFSWRGWGPFTYSNGNLCSHGS